MGAGSLRGPGVLKDLVGLHHRVQWRVGLGVARLGAEPTVLRAAARLGIDQRAHVRRVREALHPSCPRTLNECGDRDGVLELAEAQRLLAGYERRHGAEDKKRLGRLLQVAPLSGPATWEPASRRTPGPPPGSPPKRSRRAAAR